MRHRTPRQTVGTLKFRRHDAERLCATITTLTPTVGATPDAGLAQLQGALQALLLGILGIAESFTRTEIDAIYGVLRRTMFAVATAEALRTPAYYAGQVSLLLELADLYRHEAIPRHAFETLATSELAQLAAKVVLDHDGISPTELAEKVDRSPSNLVSIARKLESSGLVRRETFGSRVRLFSTPLLRAVAAQKLLETHLPAVVPKSSEPQTLLLGALHQFANAYMVNLSITPHASRTIVSIEKKGETPLRCSFEAPFHEVWSSLFDRPTRATRRLMSTDPLSQTVTIHGTQSLKGLNAPREKKGPTFFDGLNDLKQRIDFIFAIGVSAGYAEAKGNTALAAKTLGAPLNAVTDFVKKYQVKQLPAPA